MLLGLQNADILILFFIYWLKYFHKEEFSLIKYMITLKSGYILISVPITF